MNEPLVLHALEVASPRRWRWLLTEADDAALADHEVHLDASAWEYAAFIDLDRYVELNIAPDDRIAEETALVERLGRWASAVALGEAVGSVLAARAPTTVRIPVPTGSEFLGTYPLEIAYINGQPLARHGITLVFEYGETAIRASALVAERPIKERLRILALFSLPVGGSMLALRRERYELTRLITTLRARSGLAIELKVLQYGVTRERLAKEARDGEGWDILHISGHGRADALVLELPDGSPDPVPADDLVRLLIPARRRLKFTVLSSCSSGAATVAETLRWLGLDKRPEKAMSGMQAGAGIPSHDMQPQTANSIQATPGLARVLVNRLGIAVLGMRYPVQDEFAIALAKELYPAILESGQSVDIAAGLAIPDAAGSQPTAGRPALSICTPALFGPAVGLKFSPPKGRPDLSEPKIAGFPQEPQRFVGRTYALLAASAALAANSGRTAVVFHGMAGIGKTSCALELAYQHRDRFEALAWWRAPEQDTEFDQAITSFASTLENRFEQYGFTMLDSVSSSAGMERFLPGFVALLRERGILLVLDNMETLLTATGSWRDPRWGRLFNALISHGGLSRLILTSRVAPAVVSSDNVLVEAVHPLSLEETVLLARELPNLRILLHAEPGPVRAGVKQTVADRDLALRTLQLVQGHPKLLELADAAAADPQNLAARLDATQTALADRDQSLEIFFATGRSALESKDLLRVLATWTTDTFAQLPVASKLLVGLLACVQDNDRVSIILKSAWPALWQTLRDNVPDEDSTEDGDNDIPSLSGALSPLVATALVQAGALKSDDPQSPVRYRIHPAIADTIRANAPQLLIDAVNQVMAQAWYQTFNQALQKESTDGEWIVQSGLSAAPYLLHLREWNAIGIVLQTVIEWDASPSTVRRALSYFDHPGPSGDGKDAMRWRSIHGKTLALVDREQAEQQQRKVLNESREKGWYDIAWIAAGDLMQLLISLGRMAEALALASDKKTLSQSAGLGPWTQFSDEVLELGLNFRIGLDSELRDQAEDLIARLDSLPARKENEAVTPWRIREDALQIGLRAAIGLSDWERALELNRKILDSYIRRGAGDYAQAQVRVNDYGPLMNLGRSAKAMELLIECQRIFTENNDIDTMGAVFSARANVEFTMNRPIEAVRYQRTALRYLYTGPIADLEFRAIASSHYNLGRFLDSGEMAASNMSEAVAHWLAAAAIYTQIGDQAHLANPVLEVARILRTPSPPMLPESFDVVSQTVQQVPGVRFQELLEAMLPEPAWQEQLFTALISAIQRVRN